MWPKSASKSGQEISCGWHIFDYARTNYRVEVSNPQRWALLRHERKFNIEPGQILCRSFPKHAWCRVNALHPKAGSCEQNGDAARTAAVIQDLSAGAGEAVCRPHEELSANVLSLLHQPFSAGCEFACRSSEQCGVWGHNLNAPRWISRAALYVEWGASLANQR